MNKHTLEELQYRQAMPLDIKIAMTKTRIREWVKWFGADGVYVSFSGGKDSTVLLDIVRQEFPEIKAMFVDVPTQYPELRQFVKTFENVDIIQPKINFFQVCENYGFPFFGKEISETIMYARKYMRKVKEGSTDPKNAWAVAENKRNGDPAYEALKKGILPEDAPVRVKALYNKVPHKEKGKLTDEYSKRYNKSQYKFMLEATFEVSSYCCDQMKKGPAKSYQKKTGRVPMTAQMASESVLRTQKWLQHGCNGFDMKSPISNPMSFWTEQDVLLYIKMNHLPICSVYGEVVSDDEEMGQMQLSDYAGMELFDLGQQELHCTGCQRTGCVLCGFGAHMPGDERFVRLRETHPGMYALLDKATNSGYTMRQAIDWISEHSDKVIRY